MKYDVTVAGPGGHTIVTVEADSGDDAATRAHKRGTVIRGVTPHVPPVREVLSAKVAAAN